MLKIGFINLFNNLPRKGIRDVCSNNSVATKNGKSEGTTDVAHNVRPFFIAGKLLLEKSNKHIANIKNIMAKKFLLIFNTKKWHFENIISPDIFLCKCIIKKYKK